MRSIDGIMLMTGKRARVRDGSCFETAAEMEVEMETIDGFKTLGMEYRILSDVNGREVLQSYEGYMCGG
jgi:hypothetical protein